MQKDWYFYNVDLREVQRMFEDEQDFVTWVHLLGWKSRIRKAD